MPDLVFALVANPYRNSRALRQIRLLVDMGLNVHVLATEDANDGIDLGPSVVVERVPVRAGQGSTRFLEISRRFLKAAKGIDAKHFHASDLYVLGAMAKAADRAPSGNATYSYDARECYPHVAATVGRPWVSRYWQWMERRFVLNAAFVFTVSESIATHMTKIYGIERPHVVMNVPESLSFEPSDFLRREIGLSDRPKTPIILHLGQMRRDRGCEILVQSMVHVDRAHLVFLGSGPLLPTLSDLASESGLADRVHFIEPVSPDRVLSVTCGAAIGVTLLQGTCLNHEFALPNKLFEYISAGVPVAASGLVELKRIISATGVGCSVMEYDPLSVGKTLQNMLTDPVSMKRWSAAALKATETFNWDVASQPFREAFRALSIPNEIPHDHIAGSSTFHADNDIGRHRSGQA